MAVDDDVDTYWASKFDELEHVVEYVIDFGDEHKLQSLEIVWEFPARAFAIAASVDGARFTDIFATDANVLHTSRISLGHVVARKLRISLVEVRCVGWERSARVCFIDGVVFFVLLATALERFARSGFNANLAICLVLQPHPIFAR